MFNKRRGVTLTELIMVLAIMSIILALVFPLYTKTVKLNKQTTASDNRLDAHISFQRMYLNIEEQTALIDPQSFESTDGQLTIRGKNGEIKLNQSAENSDITVSSRLTADKESRNRKYVFAELTKISWKVSDNTIRFLFEHGVQKNEMQLKMMPYDL